MNNMNTLYHEPLPYLAEYVPHITLRQALIINKCDCVVAKLVSLYITGGSQAQAVVSSYQLYQGLLCATLLLVPYIAEHKADVD